MTSLSTVFAYHERTKHHFDRYARSLGYLDWANQPNPFRNYRGANETQLELDREPPPLAYDRIYEPNAAPPASGDRGSVADLFQTMAAKHNALMLQASARVAVNDEMTGWETPLCDGDEVLFFPPVAGG